jgi:hypothetical protein
LCWAELCCAGKQPRDSDQLQIELVFSFISWKKI